MTDFSDPSFRGEGRVRPPGRPNPKRGTDSLSHAVFAVGTRIRVVEDNGTRNLIGLEGVVVHSILGYVVVELDNDPLVRHRADQRAGFVFSKDKPKRHFRITEVERL